MQERQHANGLLNERVAMQAQPDAPSTCAAVYFLLFGVMYDVWRSHKKKEKMLRAAPSVAEKITYTNRRQNDLSTTHHRWTRKRFILRALSSRVQRDYGLFPTKGSSVEHVHHTSAVLCAIPAFSLSVGRCAIHQVHG